MRAKKTKELDFLKPNNYWKQNNKKNLLASILLINLKSSFKNSEDIEELKNINFH